MKFYVFTCFNKNNFIYYQPTMSENIDKLGQNDMLLSETLIEMVPEELHEIFLKVHPELLHEQLSELLSEQFLELNKTQAEHNAVQIKKTWDWLDQENKKQSQLAKLQNNLFQQWLALPSQLEKKQTLPWLIQQQLLLNFAQTQYLMIQQFLIHQCQTNQVQPVTEHDEAFTLTEMLDLIE